MDCLKIYLLGGMQVLWKERPLLPFPTHSTRSLFAYLVTYRQRAHTRNRLAGLFWGDFPETRAQRNLNNTLWRLRHALPAEYVRVEGDTIGFNTASDFWLDLAEFERIADSCSISDPQSAIRSLHSAIELYRGDFLEGWYEDWALVEAERLRLLYLRALQALLDGYRASGAFAQALECARRLLEIDSLREEVHVRAMELHAALGQREAALAQFAACQRVLKAEVGIAPSPETVTLYEQIRAGTWTGLATAHTVLPETPVRVEAPRAFPKARTPFDEFGQVRLVGREAELALLRTRLESLRADDSARRVILLAGESGIGKTRVAREASQIATTLGIATLWGACPDMQSPPPYQGLLQILRGGIAGFKRASTLPISPIWLSELSLLLPELSDEFPNLPPRSESNPERLLEALAQFVGGCARAGPHLVILEDLQWADPATLEALRFLLPRLRDLPLLFVITFRPEEIADREDLARVMTELEAGEVTERLELKRLSPEDSAMLARRVLGLSDEQARLARFIYRETEGNPFFIGEVLKALVEEGDFRLRPDGEWEMPWDREPVGQDALAPQVPYLSYEPRSIREAVQRRLATLAPMSRAVLEMAAVLSHAFDFDLLQQACDQSEEATLAATDDLLRRQLLVEENDRLGFSHDKIRQIVYKGLSRAQLRSLHRQAGHALAKVAPQQIEELANHFYLAQDYASALPYGLQAGARARALYANQSALTFLGWAIEAARHIGGDEGARALVAAHERRGQVWEHLGNYDEALADFDSLRQAATAHGDRSGIARAIRQSGWIYGDHFGDLERGLKEARRAWELAQQAGDARESAFTLSNIGAFHNMRGEYRQALEAHRAALAAFRELGDPRGEASSLQYLAVAFHFLSEYEQSLDAYRQALQLWQQIGERRTAAKTQANIGYLSISMGDLNTAEKYFRQAEATLREIEAQPALPWVLIGLGAVYRYRCECQASLKVLAEAEEIDRRTGANAYLQALIYHHTGPMYWHLGQVDAAFGDLERGLECARKSGTPTIIVGTLNIFGWILRATGQVERAAQLHAEGLALARQVAFRSGQIIAQSELGLDRVIGGECASGLADLEEALAQTHETTGWTRAAVLLNLAEGRLHAGQPEQALGLAQEATRILEKMQAHEMASWAFLILGRTHLALGRTADAQDALRRGLDCLAYAENSPTRARLLAAVEQTASLPHGRVRVELACGGAPSGRPLREDEQVTVIWTADAGAADQVLWQREGKVALRRARILRLLAEASAQGGEPTQDDLADALQVTPRTIRSDLIALRRAGHAIRTRGQ